MAELAASRETQVEFLFFFGSIRIRCDFDDRKAVFFRRSKNEFLQKAELIAEVGNVAQLRMRDRFDDFTVEKKEVRACFGRLLIRKPMNGKPVLVREAALEMIPIRRWSAERLMPAEGVCEILSRHERIEGAGARTGERSKRGVGCSCKRLLQVVVDDEKLRKIRFLALHGALDDFARHAPELEFKNGAARQHRRAHVEKFLQPAFRAAEMDGDGHAFSRYLSAE